MKGYTITTEPGVIARYALHYNGEFVFSSPNRAARDAGSVDVYQNDAGELEA